MTNEPISEVTISIDNSNTSGSSTTSEESRESGSSTTEATVADPKPNSFARSFLRNMAATFPEHVGGGACTFAGAMLFTNLSSIPMVVTGPMAAFVQGKILKGTQGDTKAQKHPSTNNPSTNNPSTNNPSTNNPSTNNPSTNNPSTNIALVIRASMAAFLPVAATLMPTTPPLPALTAVLLGTSAMSTIADAYDQTVHAHKQQATKLGTNPNTLMPPTSSSDTATGLRHRNTYAP